VPAQTAALQAVVAVALSAVVVAGAAESVGVNVAVMKATMPAALMEVATMEGAMAAAQPAQPPRYICFLCKRKFKSQPLLTRHKQLSELHRRNILKQDEENQKQKEELRQAIASVRKQIQDVEAQISKQGEPGKDLQNQRQMLELKLRQALGEYGQAQEKLEASRKMQAE